MGTLIAVVAVLGLALLIVWVKRKRKRKHDPIEYYLGWGGYSHPIGLQSRVSKQKADDVAAQGGAYLIGYYDSDGRLVRAVKILRGAVFFDFEYTYHANGKRKSAKVTNAKGVVSLREYDERGRGLSGDPSFW